MRRQPSCPRKVSTPVARCGPCCSVEAAGRSTIASAAAAARSSAAVIRFQSTSAMIVELLLPDLEPRPRDLAAFYLVDGDHLDPAGPFRKGPGDNLLVDHKAAEHDTSDQPSVQVRLPEARKVPLPDLIRAARQELARPAVVLGLVGPAGHEGVDVTAVVGVQLRLDYLRTRRVLNHSRLLEGKLRAAGPLV